MNAGSAERLSLALAGSSGGAIFSTMIFGVIGLILFIAGCAGYFAWEARGLERDLAEANTTIAQRDRDIAEANAMATNEARELEQASAEFMATIDAKQRELDDAKQRTDRTISDLRAGTVRLRGDLAASACAAGEAETGTGAGVGDATPATELWRRSQEALVRIGDRADNVTRQLTACQAIIADDRRILGSTQKRESK